MMTGQDEKQNKRKTDCIWNETETAKTAGGAWQTMAAREGEADEELVAALRGYFLTHTFDPLTGEIHRIH